MKHNRLKLGMTVLGCLSLLLAGCTNDSDPQIDATDEQVQREVETTDQNGEEVGEAQVYTVSEIIEEEDFAMMMVMPLSEAYSLALPLDESLIVEIEEEGEVRGGTFEDVVEGDTIRVYESAPHVLEKMVIVR